MANGFATYCLLCAIPKPISALTDVENQIEQINSKLTRINATAYLQSLNLPKKVCTICLTFLEGSYDFVLAVERAQHALLDLKPDIKQEIFANFEATETVLKVEQEIETIVVDRNPLLYEVDPPAISIQAPADTSSSNLPDEIENDTVKLKTKRKCKKRDISDKNPLYEEDPPAPSIDSPPDTSIFNSTGEKENETKKLNTKRKCKKKDVGVDKNTFHSEEDPPALSIDPPADASIANSTDEKENETMKLDTKPKRKKVLQLVKNASSSWKDYIWKCAICDTEFSTHEELKTHSMEYHKCCNALKCYDCNLRKGKLDLFNKHIQQKHRKPLSYSCYKCFETFPTPSKCGQHRRTHKPTPHYCKGCNTIFETEDQLKDHMSTYYRLKIRIESKSDHICETCGKCFPRKEYLASHINIHSDERPYPCTICTARFKKQSHLYRHLKTHLAENPYTCDVCNRSFKFKKYLQNHQIIHTDLAPHVCSYCNKGFKFAVNLKNHVRQHTGDRPYICSVCNRQFTCWANWNKHSKRRHNMDMSKRKPVVLKEYVETVRNKKKSGRKLKKPITKVIKQVPNENVDHS